LKTILRLALNDLKRDWKHPWSMLLLASLPLVLSTLIASVFGGHGSSATMPTVHVAVWDQDKDLLTGVLKSLATQGEASRHLRLHFVDNEQEGLRLVEQSKVSALVVLPKKMTEGLLNGQTNCVELFENPAEQVLPKVVRQGVALLALGLSGAAETLGEPLRGMRGMIRSNDFPTELAVRDVAASSVTTLRGLRTYLFPPLVQFETVPAADFHPFSTNAPSALSPP